ncbi:hypothetical protein E4G67_01705 [Candidatus Bathyarchaeota archaeon]|nr:MAG: hypothetical protein E4G67_01705 [Candidatus Bathyarchaeota archaeon]
MDYGLSKKVDETVPVVRWIASLSNGETIYENVIKDEIPAWERLSKYVEDHDISITNLRLQIAGTEVKLPAGQQGYIQKKVAWTVGGTINGLRLCIGYVQNGLALIYEVDENRGSRTQRTVDPGEPWTIYHADIRRANANSI